MSFSTLNLIRVHYASTFSTKRQCVWYWNVKRNRKFVKITKWVCVFSHQMLMFIKRLQDLRQLIIAPTLIHPPLILTSNCRCHRNEVNWCLDLLKSSKYQTHQIIIFLHKLEIAKRKKRLSITALKASRLCQHSILLLYRRVN